MIDDEPSPRVGGVAKLKFLKTIESEMRRTGHVDGSGEVSTKPQAAVPGLRQGGRGLRAAALHSILGGAGSASLPVLRADVTSTKPSKPSPRSTRSGSSPRAPVTQARSVPVPEPRGAQKGFSWGVAERQTNQPLFVNPVGVGSYELEFGSVGNSGAIRRGHPSSIKRCVTCRFCHTNDRNIYTKWAQAKARKTAMFAAAHQKPGVGQYETMDCWSKFQAPQKRFGSKFALQVHQSCLMSPQERQEQKRHFDMVGEKYSAWATDDQAAPLMPYEFLQAKHRGELGLERSYCRPPLDLVEAVSRAANRGLPGTDREGEESLALQRFKQRRTVKREEPRIQKAGRGRGPAGKLKATMDEKEGMSLIDVESAALAMIADGKPDMAAKMIAGHGGTGGQHGLAVEVDGGALGGTPPPSTPDSLDLHITALLELDLKESRFVPIDMSWDVDGPQDGEGPMRTEDLRQREPGEVGEEPCETSTPSTLSYADSLT